MGSFGAGFINSNTRFLICLGFKSINNLHVVWLYLRHVKMREFIVEALSGVV